MTYAIIAVKFLVWFFVQDAGFNESRLGLLLVKLFEDPRLVARRSLPG